MKDRHRPCTEQFMPGPAKPLVPLRLQEKVTLATRFKLLKIGHTLTPSFFHGKGRLAYRKIAPAMT